MRNAAEDFIEIIKKHRSEFDFGVVHSFTGLFVFVFCNLKQFLKTVYFTHPK
jgi:Tat protein secretion system quality control protein TatD with DNase activity